MAKNLSFSEIKKNTEFLFFLWYNKTKGGKKGRFVRQMVICITTQGIIRYAI